MGPSEYRSIFVFVCKCAHVLACESADGSGIEVVSGPTVFWRFASLHPDGSPSLTSPIQLSSTRPPSAGLLIATLFLFPPNADGGPPASRAWTLALLYKNLSDRSSSSSTGPFRTVLDSISRYFDKSRRRSSTLYLCFGAGEKHNTPIIRAGLNPLATWKHQLYVGFSRATKGSLPSST